MARADDPKAQNDLERCYKWDLSMEENREKARELFELVACQGNADAQKNLSALSR